MTRPHRLALAVAATFALVAPCRADLRGDVDGAVAKGQLGLATIAISVIDADTGADRISINADQMMVPASNMKLLTTGAALHALGGNFTFSTRLLRDGDRLIVVGDGDPGVGDPKLLSEIVSAGGGGAGQDIESFLQLWVRPVVEAGNTRVSEVVVDDRIFDRQFVHPSWPQDHLNRRYCAEVAGFDFHLNVLNFYPRPGAAGGRPDLSIVHPTAPWLEIQNRATSRQDGSEGNTAWIARRQDTNLLSVYGNVKFAYRAPVPVTFNDPPAFFAQLLAHRLAAAGVQVDGHRAAIPDDPPPVGEPIGLEIRTPIRTAVARCNRDSENLYAEALLKRMGHAMTNEPGSWINGSAIVRHVVHERLENPLLAANLRVADGSGLSRDNQVAAATLTAWLATFHRDTTIGPLFVISLAEPGVGTLKGRFQDPESALKGCQVRGKSGYIDNVSCLSGYITSPGGRRCAFSILINGLKEPGSVGKAKALQERVVSAVARDLVAAETPAAATAAAVEPAQH